MTDRRSPALLVVALAFVLLAVAPAVKYAVDRRAGDALLNAPLCTPYGVVDCLSSIGTTVTGISVGKGTKTLRLAGPEPAAGTYVLDAGMAVVADAAVGDTVIAYMWRGRVVALADGADRSYTDAAPFRDRYGAFTATLFFVLVGLAFAAKYLLRTAALDARGQWRIDVQDWRAIVYNTVLMAAVAAAFGMAFLLGDAGTDPDDSPLLPFGFMFAIVATLIIANTVYQHRKERGRAEVAPG